MLPSTLPRKTKSTLPSHYVPAMDQLKEIIQDSKMPLKKISTTAGVPYLPLWKWMTERQKKYNMLDGERIYHSLTGRTFIPIPKLARR
jgi:hypothetical protein